MENKQDSRIPEIQKKYELSGVLEKYGRLLGDAETRPAAVGVFGEGRNVLMMLAELLDIPELAGILFTGQFRLRLRYGPERRFAQCAAGTEQALSFAEFAEKLQGGGGLDEMYGIFEGAVYLPDQNLNGLELLAVTVGRAADAETVLRADICAMALSATHLLSMEERKVLQAAAAQPKEYFIYNFDMVHETERDKVRDFLGQHLGDGLSCRVAPCGPDVLAGVWAGWHELTRDKEALFRRRREAVEVCLLPEIKETLREKADAAERDAALGEQTARRLADIRQKLPEYKSRTVRHINSLYIDEIRTGTHSAVLGFYETMDRDIADGIEEESDLKALQKELPYFVMGSWEEFIFNTLNGIVGAKAAEVSPAIGEYVESRLELFLRENLSEADFARLGAVVEKNVQGGAGGAEENKVFPGTAKTLTMEGGAASRGFLPKCLIALGGIALLGSCFVPGALLMAAGFKGNSTAADEFKKDLTEAGKRLNSQCLQELQSDLERLMDRIRNETEDTVDRCYTELAEELRGMEDAYRLEKDTAGEALSGIRAELAAL